MVTNFEIPLANIYNWDEKRLKLGGAARLCKSNIYLTNVTRNAMYIHQSESLELVSLLEAISVDGSVLPPVEAKKQSCIVLCKGNSNSASYIKIIAIEWLILLCTESMRGFVKLLGLWLTWTHVRAGFMVLYSAVTV
jgi:hypothetical protein